ncbi:MAG TPA: M14 family metallopeptidase, partial [Actinomycetota bacterium]
GGGRPVADGTEVDLVLSPADHARLLSQGFDLELWRNARGLTATRLAAQQSAFGFDVFRSFDEPGGIRDEIYALAAANPKILKLVVLGTTHQGREIIALRLSHNAKDKDGKHPAVLYLSTQHAREWISTEVNRRLLHYYIDAYNAKDKGVKDLLHHTELWFVLVVNPDGYQYTFEHERLWRKNLRDNNGDGMITVGDGVDPNRNFPEHWNYDNEGSSPLPSSETYRGPSPASEPETQAIMSLYDRVPFVFHVNYHSAADLTLYGQGWQVQTPSADDPIFVALSGTDSNSAIPGFDPGVSADLYITNGDTNDWTYGERGTISWTPELGEGIPGNGFLFPDDEDLIQAEFENIFPFSNDIAMSARTPTEPVSHLGNTVEPFYLDMTQVDPEKSGNPLSDLTFDVSYGDPQPVQVLASRSIKKVELRYRINGGKERKGKTEEWDGGERFGDVGDVYYRYMRGMVTGTSPGDEVEVWFKGEKEESEHFTYTAVSETGADVLVMAAEDYSGVSPAQGPGPHHLGFFTDALDAAGVSYDVYDVDANGRTSPDALGVLSHYDAVIWYTGDDIITRDPGMVGGTASRLASDELLDIRSYLNEGGKLFYNGQLAGLQYAFGYVYDPEEGAACFTGDDAVDVRCQPLSDDFLQYYLGAYYYNVDAGLDDVGDPFGVLGTDTPYTGHTWELNGGTSADNQFDANSFIATSGLLPAAGYPQFESVASAKYDRPGGPFDPHEGMQYAYSQVGDVAYKRLTRTIDVPLTGATLSFWTSYNTEEAWDHVFVEARTAGDDDWTTLPDLNGHTSMDTGDSCPTGWRELHPHLDHYQTLNPDTTCAPMGSSGAWNAASGVSDGWEQWEVDLMPFADSSVEVSIAYASDWSVQGLGMFVDEIEVSTGEGTTSFEGADTGGWTVTGPPDGSGPNPNNFIITTAAGFPEGAAITTEDTIFLGFGFEGIREEAQRNAVMAKSMEYLLGP